MQLQVDASQRYAKMRAHTATHLLQSQLTHFFPQTKQAGSLVDCDFLRFDFVAERLLTDLELATIEKRMNQIIYMACDVTVQEMSLAEATALGAKAFFEDKYGDTVRVVQVLNQELPPSLLYDDNAEYFSSFGPYLSQEFCGGTHVGTTKDIGCFTLVSQEAVASGIKRITALTGPRVTEKITEMQGILDIAVNKLGIKTASQLQDKLDKTLREYEEIKSSMESLETQSIRTLLMGTDFASGKDLDKVFLIPPHLNFKSVLACAKGLFDDQSVLMFNKEGNFLLMTRKGVSAKDTAMRLGLKGGGNEQVVQGRDEKALSLLEMLGNA